MADVALSILGVYAIGSLDVVLLGAVACIVGRSIWSEFHLNRRLDVPSSLISLQEVGLTAAFVAMTLVLPAWEAAVAFAVLFGVYLLVNRTVALGLIDRTRRAITGR